ncbi:hypothetical protein [Halosimplex halobium]|uniref:hypothetical protein n=1 Tax=Halosimplex halobium TaxID=3396618 RepID=UPI003F55813E
MSNTQQYSSDFLDALTNALATQGTDELRVTEAADLDVVLTEIGGQAQSAVDVAAKIRALADALDSNGGDSLLVDSDGPLDVSAETITADLTSRQGRNVGKARVMDSTNTLVDPARNVDGASSSATTTSAGSGNPASVSVPDGRTDVTAAWDVSGSATVTVEVSPDGGTTWYREHQASPDSAESSTYNFSTGFDDARISVDQNLNSASIGAKGA